MQSPWTFSDAPGPVIATAIHAGHDLRPEIASRIAVDDATRLREEDPFTDRLTAVGGSTVVVHRSRFEVDLNRPREDAVYRLPEDAWGLDLWREQPSPDELRPLAASSTTSSTRSSTRRLDVLAALRTVPRARRALLQPPPRRRRRAAGASLRRIPT